MELIWSTRHPNQVQDLVESQESCIIIFSLLAIKNGNKYSYRAIYQDMWTVDMYTSFTIFKLN